MRDVWVQPRTGNTVSSVIVGIMASSALGVIPHLARGMYEAGFPSARTCSLSSPTTSTATIVVMDDRALVVRELEAAMGRAAAMQVPLDPAFSKVLSDNLWNLYQT